MRSTRWVELETRKHGRSRVNYFFGGKGGILSDEQIARINWNPNTEQEFNEYELSQLKIKGEKPIIIQDIYYSTKAFAEKSGMSEQKVRRLIREGTISATKRNGKWQIHTNHLPQ